MPLVAASAVAIGLWVTGSELDIMAQMGATMILGITTEVAIFYFTEYETLLSEGMAPERALAQAGVNRLRPIAMTTLAAILALAISNSPLKPREALDEGSPCVETRSIF